MYNEDPSAHESEHLRLSDYGKTVTALPPAANWPGARRTFNNVDYYSDGTQWLSATQYMLQLPFAPAITYPASATATTVLRAGAPDEALALYINKITVKFNTATTLDVTNNWTITLRRFDNVPTGANLGTISSWATGRVAGKPYIDKVTLNTAYLLTDITAFTMDVTKNNAPGTLNFEPAVVFYRLIGV